MSIRNLLAGLLLGAAACATPEFPKEFQGRATETGKTGYVASGFEISRNPVSYTELSASNGKLSGYAGTFVSLGRKTSSPHTTYGGIEHDFGLSWTQELIPGKLTTTAAFECYFFPRNKLQDAKEPSLSLDTTAIPGPDTVGVKVISGGLWAAEGQQYRVYALKRFDLLGDERPDITVGLTGCWNDHYFSAKSGPAYFKADVEVPVYRFDKATLSLFGEHWSGLDNVFTDADIAGVKLTIDLGKLKLSSTDSK